MSARPRPLHSEGCFPTTPRPPTRPSGMQEAAPHASTWGEACWSGHASRSRLSQQGTEMEGAVPPPLPLRKGVVGIILSGPSRSERQFPAADTRLLMHRGLAPFPSPSPFSILLMELPGVTSGINLHSNLHLGVPLGEAKQRQVISSKSRAGSKSHRKDNLYMAQVLLTLPLSQQTRGQRTCHVMGVWAALLFFFKHFIFRERGREGEREGEKHQCVVASCVPPTRDVAGNLDMCPYWESNW